MVPLIVSQFWRGEGGLKGLVLDGGLAAFRVGGLASASNPPVSAQPHGSQSLLGPLRGVGCFQFPDWCFPFPWCFLFPDWFFSVPVVFLVPRSWCFQFLDWCFPCPAPVLVFLVPRFGCFQSWTMCSLPGSCVGVPFHVFVCQLSFEFLATIAHRWI